MELSGNGCEQTVGVGSPSGRAFQGTCGDGILNADGTANPADWPSASEFRGGMWLQGVTDYQRVSNRGLIAGSSWINNMYGWGGRAVRQAP